VHSLAPLSCYWAGGSHSDAPLRKKNGLSTPIPYHTIPHHTTPHHTTPHHTTPHHTIPYHGIPFQALENALNIVILVTIPT